MKNVLSVILSISLALSFPIELIAEPNAGLMDTVNFFIESAALSIGDSSNVDSEFESKNDLRDSGLSYDSTAQTDSIKT